MLIFFSKVLNSSIGNAKFSPSVYLSKYLPSSSWLGVPFIVGFLREPSSSGCFHK